MQTATSTVRAEEIAKTVIITVLKEDVSTGFARPASAVECDLAPNLLEFFSEKL